MFHMSIDLTYNICILSPFSSPSTPSYMTIHYTHYSPIDHPEQKHMQRYCSNRQLLSVFTKQAVVRVTFPPPPMKAVQVVVPDQRDGGQNDRLQRKVRQGQTEEQIQVTVAVGIGGPDEHKNFKNVENDRDEPGTHSPAGHHALGRWMKLVIEVFDA